MQIIDNRTKGLIGLTEGGKGGLSGGGGMGSGNKTSPGGGSKGKKSNTTAPVATFQSSAHVESAVSGAVSCARPTGAIAGDFLLATVNYVVADASTTHTVTAPAGWTEVTNNLYGTSGGATGARVYTFRKFVTQAEIDANPSGATAYTFTPSHTGGRLATTTVLAFRGVNTTTPIETFANRPRELTNGHTTANINVPTKGLLVANVTSFNSTVTFTPPASMTSRVGIPMHTSADEYIEASAWSATRLFATFSDGLSASVNHMSTVVALNSPSSTPAVFDPTVYGNLAFWLDPYALAGADGTAIASVTNKGNAGGTLAQATGTKQPTLQTVNGKKRLRFDGVDDFLSMASLDLSTVDKITVVYKAGHRVLTGDQIVLETSVNYNNNNGSFIAFKGNDNKPSYGHSSPISAVISTILAVANTEYVFLGTSNRALSSGETRAFVDTTAMTSLTNNNTTGNFTSQPLYVGMRGGASLPAAIDLGDAFVYRGVLTDAQLSALRTDLGAR